MRVIRLYLRYWYRLAVIKAHMYYRLSRLTLAGWAIKLGFWIEPELERKLSRGFRSSR